MNLKFVAVADIALEQYLRIGFSVKGQALSPKLLTKLAEVEDLAIEDDALSAGAVPHGLVRHRPCVDDGQSPVTKAHPFLNVNILKVRTAGRECLGGGSYIDFRKFTYEVKREYAGDATHDRDLTLRITAVLP